MRFVHVAGTNGKGSVSEYIYRILMAAGKSTGCFTSPHLVSPTERIRLNGQDIPMAEYDAGMAEAAERKLAVNDTLFAQQTAAALLWLEKNGAEYAVIETGLGGRKDATNVLSPEVTVLTSIGIDHTDILGTTLEQIAYDKCGIIKPGVPVVSAPQHRLVADMIADTCKQKGSMLHIVEDVTSPEGCNKSLTSLPQMREVARSAGGSDKSGPILSHFLSPSRLSATAPSSEGANNRGSLTPRGVCVISCGLSGQTFEFQGESYNIRMIGAVQPVNAAMAILAARTLGLPKAAIHQGLKDAMVPCRTQYISGMPDMLLDGAHNTPAIEMLLQTLDQHFAGREVALLFACMRNKDYAGMAQRLGPRCRKAFVTNVDLERGMDTVTLQSLFAAHTDCAAEDDAERAYELAREYACEHDALLLVCGSLYLAGRVWGKLRDNKA